MWEIFRIFVSTFKIKNMDKFLRYSPLILMFSIIIIAIGLSEKYEKYKPIVAMSKENYEIQTRTIDSLQSVIDGLQGEIVMLENGFDSMENRYEDIISEYELGISYLKDYHPNAYKDFHRIIGMRERFSIELERENTKRLNSKEL
jgi:hypothetical protein